MRIEFKCQKETTLSVSENGKKVFFLFYLGYISDNISIV